MTEPAPSSTGRTVALTGASGLIGSALTAALHGRGDQVIHLVRRAPRMSGPVREVPWQPGGDLDPALLTGVDAVVHLAGAGIGDRRWDTERKRELVDSRLEGTGTIARAVAARATAPQTGTAQDETGQVGTPRDATGQGGTPQDATGQGGTPQDATGQAGTTQGGTRQGATGRGHPLPRLLSASAVGYYGDRGDEVLTEDSSAGDGFLAQLCRDWEAATWPAQKAGASVAHLRTGIVLAPRGGALGRLLPLLRLGLAGPLGSGRQYWSWITLHDHVRAILFLLDRPGVTGPVNLTGPLPATQVEVVRALGRAARRPTLLPAPSPALRLVLGEMAGEILGSQRALPDRLSRAGFSFDHADLDTAATWVIEQPG